MVNFKSFVKLLFITLFFGALFTSLNQGADASTFYFSPANSNFTQSCHYSVDVRLNTQGVDSNAADILINYDPTKVQVLDSNPFQSGVQVRSGVVYPSYFGNIVDNGIGEIRLTGADFASSFNGDGVFATIEFMSVNGATDGQFDIYFTGSGPYVTLDSNIADAVTSNDTLSGVTNANYTFSAGSCFQDTTPPTIQNIVPVNGQQAVAGTSNLQVRVSDSGSGVDISTVELVLNGVTYDPSDSQFTYSGSPASYLITVNPDELIPADSASVLLVKATDLSGNYRQQSITFNVPQPAPAPPPPPAPVPIPVPQDNTSPLIQFIDPVPRSEILPEDNFTVTISDDGSGVDLESIQIILNGEVYTIDDFEVTYDGDSSSYTVTLNPDIVLISGNYTLTIFALDQSGNGSIQTTIYTIRGETVPERPDEEIICYNTGTGEKVDVNSLCRLPDPETTQPIVDLPISERIINFGKDISPGLVASSTFSLPLLSLLAFDSIPGLLLRGLFGLLKLLGLRKDGVPFGYVYDSESKEPVSQAIVRIYDSGNRLVRTDVTDFNGVFTGELNEGTYRITVNKIQYTFPSKIVTTPIDGEITKVYRGESFSIKKNSEIDFSIPIDRRELNRFERSLLWVKNSFVSYIYLLFNVIFFAGALASLVLFITYPTLSNALVILLYVVIFILSTAISRAYRAKYGTVLDDSQAPVSGAVVGLYKAADQTLLGKRITDSYGRYRFITRRGSYILKVLNKELEQKSSFDEIIIRKDDLEVSQNIYVSKRIVVN